MEIKCGYIENKKVKTKEVLNIVSPIDNKIIASFYGMNAGHIDKAFDLSSKAFYKWKFTSFRERAKILRNFSNLLLENKNYLSDLLVKFIAKSKKDSLNEIERSCSYIKETIQVYDDLRKNPLIIDSSTNLGVPKNKTGIFTREPLGVILAISPFNYPVNLLISKIAPALISGNCVVFKPASQAMIIGIKLFEYLMKAGIPENIVQCVSGSGKFIGDSLITNSNIAAISFTGSPVVGNQILEKSKCGNLVLEMGGKDAALVMDDADINLSAKEIVKGAFSYSGQRCTAIKRVMVHKRIADKLIFEIKNLISKLTLGNPNDNVDIVPLVDKKSADYVMELINDAIKLKAKICCGGNRVGNLIKPCLIDNVTEKMRIAWEEPFGPVLPVIRTESLDEMIMLHNKSKYGLQASVFTNSEQKFKKIANLLEVGSVNWNRSSSRGPDIFPFIGIKNSGLGVQGITDSILSMTRYKGFIVNK